MGAQSASLTIETDSVFARWIEKEARLESNWVFLVAGGLLQVPAAKAIKELGYNLCVSDRDLGCACAGLADHFVELDTFDIEGHIDFVQSWPYGFAAVFTPYSQQQQIPS